MTRVNGVLSQMEVLADEWIDVPAGPVIIVDASLGRRFKIAELVENATVEVINPTLGRKIQLRFQQDSAGGRVVTFNGITPVGSVVVSTVAAAASYVDIVENGGGWEAVGVPDLSTVYANRALSNLAATAINMDLLPQFDASISLGTASLRFKEINFNVGAFFWIAAGDAFPATAMLAGRFTFGAGGASDTDVTIGRLAVGVAGLGLGQEFRWQGGTSGYVGLISPAAPTSWTLTLPTGVPGGNGFALTSTTGGVSSWTNLAALYQPLSAQLGALAAFSGTGIMARTGANTFSARTMTPAGTGILIADGDGIGANPTFSLDVQTGWSAGTHATNRTLANGASLSDTQDYLLTLVADLLAGKFPRA